MGCPSQEAVANVLRVAADVQAVSCGSTASALKEATECRISSHIAIKAWVRVGGVVDADRLHRAAKLVAGMTDKEWSRELRLWGAYVRRLIKAENQRHAAAIEMYRGWL